MEDNQPNQKTIELWDGFAVPVNEQLFDDFDFMSDLSTAINSGNLGETAAMYMAIVGGEPTYHKVREHIEKEHGYFSQEALSKITKKIDALFPKAGNRAQRRSWRNTI